MKKKVNVERIELPQDPGKYSWLFELFFLSLLTIGCIGLICGIGKLSMDIFPFIISPAILILLLQVKNKNLVNTFCILAIALLFALFRSDILNSIMYYYNNFILYWDHSFHTYFEGFNLSSSFSSYYFSLLISDLVTIMIYEIYNRRAWIVLSVVVFLLLDLSILLSAVNLIFSVCVLLGWFYLWFLRERKKVVYIKGMLSIFGGFFMICLCFTLFVQLTQFTTLTSSIKNKASEVVSEVRYGNDTLPQGNLCQATYLLNDENDRLQLTGDSIGVIYLRGYVGSTFHQNQWEELDAQSYSGDMRGMLAWMKENGIESQTMYSNYQNIENSSKTTSLTVENIGANRKYIYTPDTISSFNGHTYQDWQYTSTSLFGSTSYRYDYYNQDESCETENSPDWYYSESEDASVTNFQNVVHVYNAFVEENYLDVDESDQEIINQVFFNGESWNEESDLYSITSRIRVILNMISTYNDNPDSVDGNTSFVSWYLQQYQQGNSISYATIATLAFRCAGLPARYVEGYYVDGKGADSITLTSQNAHAWCEVYIEGQGWRPIEVTPGFYSEVYVPDTYISVPEEDMQGTSGQMAITPNETYDNSFEEEQVVQKKQPVSLQLILFYLLLVLVIVWLCLEIHALYKKRKRQIQYEKSSSFDKTVFLYDAICTCLAGLIPGFNSQQPLKSKKEIEQLGLDSLSFLRMVARYEKVIYGDIELNSREIESLEIYYQDLYKMYMNHLKWYQKIKNRYF